MVVVVIIAILATVAIPSYRRYVMRGHRSAAQAAMMDIANREQQILLANRSYVDAAGLAATGYVLPPDVSGFYTLGLTAPAGAVPTFFITMTPIGAQAPDGALTLNYRGDKAPDSKWRGR